MPNPGWGWDLTLAQADANLAYLIAHKAERLHVVSGLLATFGIDLAAGLASQDPKPFLDDLWKWVAAEWPAIVRPELLTLDAWLTSRRDGLQIAFSLVIDIAIVLAEVVLVRRPDYRWAIDVDPGNRADTRDETMVSWHRPVVMRVADGTMPTILFDFEDVARGAYVDCGSTGTTFENDLGRGALDAISGAHERQWREEAALLAARSRRL